MGQQKDVLVITTGDRRGTVEARGGGQRQPRSWVWQGQSVTAGFFDGKAEWRRQPVSSWGSS